MLPAIPDGGVMTWSGCLRFVQILCAVVALRAEAPLVLLTEPWPPYITQDAQARVSGLHTEIILAVPAIVRSEREIDDRTLEGAKGYGIEFVDLTPEDTVALMTYIAAVQTNPTVTG